MAHKIEAKERTQDVSINAEVTFSSFSLKPSTKNGLIRCGYVHPSPIQSLSIPDAIIGVDLVIQAKSGTGKTVVFAVASLQTLSLPSSHPQVLIISPTREIATQIVECITQIGRVTEGLVVKSFIGGTDLQVDKKSLKTCNIAVGTPGRIKQLIETKMLNPSTIRLLVLDEADKLMEPHFIGDVNSIIGSVPKKKQMIASSATYPDNLSKFLTKYMRNPKEIRLGSSDPSLIGVRQFFSSVKSESEKNALVVEILDLIPFSQAMIFFNNRDRSKMLFDLLHERGHAVACISGEMSTKERAIRMTKFKSKQLRALISTDLCSRGIDAENVDLVLNLDIPYGKSALETYLHRIGRSGRFGSKGTAITILQEKSREAAHFFQIVRDNCLKVSQFATGRNDYVLSAHKEEYQEYLNMIESDRNVITLTKKEKSRVEAEQSIVPKKKFRHINLNNRKRTASEASGSPESDFSMKKSRVTLPYVELNDADISTFIENCIEHDDVSSASIDQPTSVAACKVIEAVFPTVSLWKWKQQSLPVFLNFLNPQES